MALTTVNANLAWQEAKVALSGQSTTTPFGIPQVVANQFAALKAHLAQFKGNPNLFFAPFQATDVDDASGVVVMGFPATIYGVFARKLATGVDTYLYLIDDATDDASAVLSTASDTRVVLPFIGSQDIATLFYPGGLAMAAGIVAKAYTDPVSSTTQKDASSADTPSGFLIIGDPL
jgi:hypothetical protein